MKKPAKKAIAKRKIKREIEPDVNQLAHHLIREITESRSGVPPEISQYMAAIGKRGGEIGGKRRLETMSQERRSQIAFKAAQARWKKKARKP